MMLISAKLRSSIAHADKSFTCFSGGVNRMDNMDAGLRGAVSDRRHSDVDTFFRMSSSTDSKKLASEPLDIRAKCQLFDYKHASTGVPITEHLQHVCGKKSRLIALAALNVLAETCKSALETLATLSRSVSRTQAAPVQVIRNDMLSINRLIHTSTTRLSIALGKPPPSYSIALVPLKDLATHVAQLSSCVSAFPPGSLRKEAVWATEELVQALDTLIHYFESHCRRDVKIGNEYLARTGAVHDAIAKAEKMSQNELEAVAKAWRINIESLEDSLKEVKEMMEDSASEAGLDSYPVEDDGWDELGEGFGGKLGPEEMERVKKIYPFLRLTVLLHERVLSRHILLASVSHSEGHLTNLLQLSERLLPATDDLASALYAPQDIENIREGVAAMHSLTKDFNQELAEEASEEGIREALQRLQLDSNDVSAKTRVWFQKCFSQIDIICDSLSLDTPS